VDDPEFPIPSLHLVKLILESNVVLEAVRVEGYNSWSRFTALISTEKVKAFVEGALSC
jgi:hypothetical protein